MRLGVSFASLAICALLSQQRGFGEGSARITGVVFSAAQGDRAVIPGAHVTLMNADNVRETLTDAKGEFIFADVTPGSWSVGATTTGLSGSATSVQSTSSTHVMAKPEPTSE